MKNTKYDEWTAERLLVENELRNKRLNTAYDPPDFVTQKILIL